MTPNRAAQPNKFTLAITRDGKPVTGADVTATFAMLDMEMGQQGYAFKEVSPGVYSHSAPALVMVGHWGITFDVEPPGGAAVRRRARRPGERMTLRALAAVAAVALLAAPIARADGDPASDYLITRQTFLPFDAKIPKAQVDELNGIVADANKKGFKIRVAIIVEAVRPRRRPVAVAQAEDVRALPRPGAHLRLQEPAADRDAERLRRLARRQGPAGGATRRRHAAGAGDGRGCAHRRRNAGGAAACCRLGRDRGGSVALPKARQTTGS